MLPKLEKHVTYPVITKAKADRSTVRRIKVGVPTGCVQDIFFNQVNHDTINVGISN